MINTIFENLNLNNTLRDPNVVAPAPLMGNCAACLAYAPLYKGETGKDHYCATCKTMRIRLKRISTNGFARMAAETKLAKDDGKDYTKNLYEELTNIVEDDYNDPTRGDTKNPFKIIAPIGCHFLTENWGTGWTKYSYNAYPHSPVYTPQYADNYLQAGFNFVLEYMLDKSKTEPFIFLLHTDKATTARRELHINDPACDRLFISGTRKPLSDYYDGFIVDKNRVDLSRDSEEVGSQATKSTIEDRFYRVCCGDSMGWKL